MSWLKYSRVFMFVSCVFAGNYDRPLNLPCKINDSKCLVDLVQWIYSTNVRGIPAQGIETMDPLKHDVIYGDLGFVKYNLSNTYLEGMKSCVMEVIKVSSNLTAMHLEMRCPQALLVGEYVIEGKLLGVPIKGGGIYNIVIKNFYSTLELDVSYYKIGNKLHHKHHNYNYKGELLGDMSIELKNLDGSKKHLSEGAKTVLKFAQENAKVFAGMIGMPVHNENTKKLIKNMNKRLKHIPTLELIQIDEKRVKIEKD